MSRLVAPSAGVPPPWSTLNTHIVLWHGTTRSAAQNILALGVDLTKSRNDLDFGRGFYTTTSKRQAREWAFAIYRLLPPAVRAADRPALLQFRLRLDALGDLDPLMFVRGDPAHVAFWSFVHHCRSGGLVPHAHLHPGRPTPGDWYDVVCGPLAKTWPPRGREAIPNSDQFSFHTAAAVAILNGVIAAGRPDFQLTVL